MANLRALKDRAAELASKGKLDRAAEAYRSVLKADPRDAATRQRLAEVLRRADRVGEAVEEYAAVADRYAHDGLFAKAIALCKTILEIDPGHATTQATLAELYAARARGAPPTRLTAMAIPAVLAPASLAPAPKDPGEGNVELPLPRAAAVPLGITPAPAVPETTGVRVLSAAQTPLAQILSAAQAATAAGIEEDVVLDLDEPLEIVEAPPVRVAPPPASRDVDEPLAAAPSVAEAEADAEAPALAAASPGADEAGELLGDEILEAGPEEPAASAEPRGAPVPGDMALPRIPLFSDLSREAFIALTDGMVLHRVRAGQTVLQEGEAGTSFFVVAGGRLAVTKRDDRGDRVRLARLGEGDFFGEMAILAGAPRLATVTAEESAELLEVRAEDLLALAGRYPHLAVSLRRFYRQRLLANAMAVSPVFRPFSREDRREVMARFRTREVVAGEVVVREGEPSDGLYVVLDGALAVSRRRGAEGVEVAELREADVFGEMSCLRKAPATATVTARRAGTLLRLPRQGFDELVLSHPQILEVVSELTEERAESLDAILSGHAQWTEEGLVLV
jgi:CRP-like cAMP-binding protein